MLMQATNSEEMVKRLKIFFNICRNHGMWLSRPKIQVGPIVELAGQDLSNEGCTLTANKYSALQNCQPPKNLNELRGFMCLVNWLSVQQPDLRNVTPSLRSMMSTKVTYLWIEKHQEEFDTIIRIFKDPLFLKPFQKT